MRKNRWLAAAAAGCCLLLAGTDDLKVPEAGEDIIADENVADDTEVDFTDGEMVSDCTSADWTDGGSELQSAILDMEFPQIGQAETENTIGDSDWTSILEQGLAKLLPDRWYAGDYGKKPVVKSQGKYGTCWALTATSALEAVLLPSCDTVFSADHMVLSNAFTADIEDGGDYLMTMAYLSGWQGPVTEAEDPYGDEISPDGLTAAVHVQEMQLLSGVSLEEVKQAVYEYGAVQTSLYMSRATTAADASYYNEATAAYYYPDTEVQNHDVLILGWDDSFSRLKFAKTPPIDGAFICQNTWGSDFGEDGIFYVSYADANIMKSGILYSRVEASDNYDCIYQADDCGWQGKQGYGDGTCWFANVYTVGAEAEADSAEEKDAEAEADSAEERDVGTEMLAAVGFYATSENVEYEIYLVRNFESYEDFDRREFLQSGSMARAGYYTVDLEEERQLTAGERFAVIVKITAAGEKNPVAVEYQADEYTQNVTLDGKESYLSQYGTYWENTQERFGTNVCLKAYTR